MKKTLAYVVTAVLLGTIIMVFPVLILYPSQISTMRALAPPPTPLPAPASEAVEDTGKLATEVQGMGVAPFPLSLAYAGFIFILGFMVGLCVAQYYKRRMV